MKQGAVLYTSIERFLIFLFFDCIGDVMGSVLPSSMVDQGFEPGSGQTKDYNIGICCFCVKPAALRHKSKIRIMCPSGATTKRIGLVQS